MLLGDQPYDRPQDPLGFDAIAEELASLILDSRGSTPFTLGIEAAWGMGKSTLMRSLCLRLDEGNGVTAVTFNAWTADDGDVLEGLVKTVLSELDPNALRRALRNEKLVSGLRAGLSVVAGFLGLGNVVDTFWNQVAADPRARNDLRKLVGEAVDDWRDKQPEIVDGRLLCVFIDDLDRCSPQGVLGVFEAMKLYLDVPGIVFVVGYDQDIVSDLVLREKGYSSGAIESRDYLEKFIQIVYRIPRPVPERSTVLIQSLLETSGTGELFGPPEREIMIEGSDSNPRRIKRFINAFVLAYGLDSRWRELEPETLVRLQLLQMYFPEFARMLERPAERDPIKEFLDYREARDALRRHDPRERGDIQQMLKRLDLAVGEEESYDAALTRLEENVPVAFAPLAGRADVVLLVESIAAAPGWPELRGALAAGALPLAEEPEGSPASSGAHGMSLRGLRVLWVDDEMERNESLANLLSSMGATYSFKTRGAGVAELLHGGEFDVLISDIMRDGDSEAGFKMVSQLRKELLLLPVIFFTTRITDARTRRARELDAAITADSNDLFAWLQQQAIHAVERKNPTQFFFSPAQPED